MSNEKSRDALGEAAIPQRNNPAVDVSSGSPLDMVLWVIALILLVGAMVVNQYLPAVELQSLSQYIPQLKEEEN